MLERVESVSGGAKCVRDGECISGGRESVLGTEIMC